MHTRAQRRIALSVVSGALAMVLLTGGVGTYARWSDSEGVGGGSLSAGSADLTLDAAATLQLLSRQPSGSRTYVSTQPCPVPTGYQQCRVVTTTLPQERLIVGDTVRVAQPATLNATGTNLRGNVTVDTRRVVTAGTSALSAAATVTSTVTTPGGTTTALTGGQGSFPVNVANGTGVGTYTVSADVNIPAANGGSRWGTALRGQPLDLDTISLSFVQTR